jgi:hypothetical protein
MLDVIYVKTYLLKNYLTIGTNRRHRDETVCLFIGAEKFS